MEVWVVTADGAEQRSVDELPALLAADEGVVWVDIPDCDPDAVKVLSEVFRFHPLAVKDSIERNRVPKMHAYTDHVFVVVHGPQLGARGHVHYIELDQFIGRRYLVTVHGPVNSSVEPSVPLRETRAVKERMVAGRFRPATAFELSHAIVSALTRTQEEFVETVTTDVWRLEQQLTGGQVGDPEEFLDDLFRARHALLAVRTMGAQSAAVYESMVGLPDITDVGRVVVTDDARQFELVRDLAGGQLEYVHGVIEYYQTRVMIKSTLVARSQNDKVRELTEASYKQSEVVKKISSWAAILLAPTLIGTIYGMNFEDMPELEWSFGYPLAVLAMALIAGGLYIGFKKRGWL